MTVSHSLALCARSTTPNIVPPPARVHSYCKWLQKALTAVQRRPVMWTRINTAVAHLGLSIQLASDAAGVGAVLCCQLLHPADAISHTSSGLLNACNQLLLQLLGGLLGSSTHSLHAHQNNACQGQQA